MLTNLSFWEKSAYLTGIDLAVVGSGIVGLNAAITFKEKYPSAKVIVLERGVFPSGASTKNAGFACFGSVSELLDDLDTMGESAVLSLVEKRWQGLRRLRERCGDKAIDYQSLGGYELFLKQTEDTQKCIDAMPSINKSLEGIIGIKDTFSIEKDTARFGFGKIKKMLFNQAEGQINPAKMMERLRYIANEKQIQILTGVTVEGFEESANEVNIQVGEGATIRAAKVLVATNGLTNRLLPGIALQPARNQVLITEPIPNLSIKGTFHFEKGYYYFRNYEHRILLGGARNIAKDQETTDKFGLTRIIQNRLELFLREVILPNHSVQIAHRWSGILGVGNQKSPIVQMHSENIGIAIRLGGMGVAIGSLVGEEGAALFY